MRSSSTRSLVTIAATLLLSVTAGPAFAQSPEAEEGWNVTLAPYLLIPHMNGDVTFGPTTVDVDASPSDIFSRLKFGAMLFVEAANPDWAVFFDGIYMNLGETGQTPVTDRDVDVSMKQGAFEATGLRRLGSWAELGIGGRLNILDAGVEVAEGDVLPGRDILKTYTWFDPVISTRLMVPLESRWSLGLRGDIGGFGIGSDFTWQVYPKVGYRFSSLFELAAAYRAMGIKYETGSAETLFIYDMVIFGPELGLVFHF